MPRLSSVLRWLGPSAIAAIAGALVAGGVEARGDATGVLATLGFVGLVAAPVLAVAAVVVRALWIAWRPRELLVVEDGGATPWLAGWIAVAWLASYSLAWAMFQGTWLLNNWTAFKPLPLGFLEPMLAVATSLVIVALSRPVALAIAALARRFDRRWRRSGRRSIVVPRVILVGAAVTWLVALYAIWQLLVKRRLGALDTSVLVAPLAGIVTCAIVHVAWPRLAPRVRQIASAAIALGFAVAVGTALHVAWQRPNLALAIWADEPLAGVALDAAFDVDAIRDRVELAPYRLAPRPGAAHPDLVLVTIDTLRADRTPPYQGPAEMPVLRDLGQRGTVFLWTFATANTTGRSLASLVTGFSSERVRGTPAGWGFALDPRHVTLAERLAAGGYDTAGFFCCDELWGERAHTGWSRGLAHVAIEPDGARLARTARTWIEARDRAAPRRPLFVWIHLLEPSERVATRTPKTDDERRRFYDQQLAAADAALVDVFSAFANRAPDRAPIAIVTSDHGQGLGEHGHATHGSDLYNAQVHVPLVIVGPGIRPQRLTETTSLVDVFPTILELAGFVPPRGDGHSLADLATGRRTSLGGGFAYGFMFDDATGKQDTGMVVRGSWKLIDNGTTTELYDLRSDLAERYNLFSQRSQIVNELKALLAMRRRAAQRSPFD
ncbi:MAG TPA: sulfatase-like hydrolase/transferase [Kofleriaceae bacterium]|nr:sulfatase-like hydrolase/transferase [Kofleriaceae bacterium]